MPIQHLGNHLLVSMHRNRRSAGHPSTVAQEARSPAGPTTRARPSHLMHCRSRPPGLTQSSLIGSTHPVHFVRSAESCRVQLLSFAERETVPERCPQHKAVGTVVETRTMRPTGTSDRSFWASTPDQHGLLVIDKGKVVARPRGCAPAASSGTYLARGPRKRHPPRVFTQVRGRFHWRWRRDLKFDDQRLWPSLASCLAARSASIADGVGQHVVAVDRPVPIDRPWATREECPPHAWRSVAVAPC